MMLRKRYSFFLDDDLGAGLKALKERDGITQAEAVRRAVAEFLKYKRIIGTERMTPSERNSVTSMVSAEALTDRLFDDGSERSTAGRGPAESGEPRELVLGDWG